MYLQMTAMLATAAFAGSKVGQRQLPLALGFSSGSFEGTISY
jgi:hypothetical protein